MVLRKTGEYFLLSVHFLINHIISLFDRLFFEQEKVSDELHCQWVSSRALAMSCDVFPAAIKSDERAFDPSIYQNIKDGDSVYVISKSMKGFYQEIIPVLREKSIKITLVTGASVRGVPNEISEQHDIDYLSWIASEETIRHWYTQNCDLETSHEKISPIPLGLDYHTLKKKPFWWGPRSSPVEQEKLLKAIEKAAPQFDQRRNKSYSFFHFNLFGRHDQDRENAIKALEKKHYNDFAPSRMTRKRTWQICSRYKYIISPHGNGLDCHRTYEAIALGCMPVVTSSPLDRLYEGLPVIVLEAWTDCTIDHLNEKALALKNSNLEKLTLQYWQKIIFSNEH